MGNETARGQETALRMHYFPEGRSSGLTTRAWLLLSACTFNLLASECTSLTRRHKLIKINTNNLEWIFAKGGEKLWCDSLGEVGLHFLALERTKLGALGCREMWFSRAGMCTLWQQCTFRVRSLCVCVCVRRCLRGQKRVLDPLELELQVLWDTWLGCWELNLISLTEQQAFSRAEPFLQSQQRILYN